MDDPSSKITPARKLSFDEPKPPANSASMMDISAGELQHGDALLLSYRISGRGVRVFGKVKIGEHVLTGHKVRQ